MTTPSEQAATVTVLSKTSSVGDMDDVQWVQRERGLPPPQIKRVSN